MSGMLAAPAVIAVCGVETALDLTQLFRPAALSVVAYQKRSLGIGKAEGQPIALQSNIQLSELGGQKRVFDMSDR